MADEPHPAPGPYRHYKGGRYTVICVGRHSETEEWLVTYRAEASGTYWVRPLLMWNETVLHEGRTVPRFAPAAGEAVIPPRP